MNETANITSRQPTALSGLVLRASSPEDARELTALSNLTGFRRGTMRLPFGREADTRRSLESQGPDKLHLVAILGAQIVGSADLSMFSGRRRHAAGIGMGVHDDHVGQGIGSALLAALLETTDKWLDLSRVELTVFADNAPAIALYRKFGFEEEGTLRAWGYREGGLADVLAMARLRR